MITAITISYVLSQEQCNVITAATIVMATVNISVVQ